ncbi:putative LRR containing protein, partial [Trachipleistophora hominis]
VPVTKSLYSKLVKLSKRETVELDDLEISDYAIYLLKFMDGKLFILRSICQQLMDSEDLNKRVKKHCYDTYVSGGEDWIKLTPGWSLSYND